MDYEDYHCEIVFILRLNINILAHCHHKDQDKEFNNGKQRDTLLVIDA